MVTPTSIGSILFFESIRTDDPSLVILKIASSLNIKSPSRTNILSVRQLFKQSRNPSTEFVSSCSWFSTILISLGRRLDTLSDWNPVSNIISWICRYQAFGTIGLHPVSHLVSKYNDRDIFQVLYIFLFRWSYESRVMFEVHAYHSFWKTFFLRHPSWCQIFVALLC